MRGHEHYVSGENWLEAAKEERSVQGADEAYVMSMLAIAQAHFLAASAATALAGRYRDPTRDLATAERLQAERAPVKAPLSETVCLLAPNGCEHCLAGPGQPHFRFDCPDNVRALAEYNKPGGAA